MLSSMSSFVGPRGAQDGSPTSWQHNRKNNGWQSVAIGCKNLSQMALRGFLMLLRVTSVGFPSLWKISALRCCGWMRWTTPGGPEKRFPFKKESVHHFLQYSGACCCQHSARQCYNHYHILHNFSFARSSSAYLVNSTDLTSVSNPVASRQCSSS